MLMLLAVTRYEQIHLLFQSNNKPYIEASEQIPFNVWFYCFWLY